MDQDTLLLKDWAVQRMQHFLDLFKNQKDPAQLEPAIVALIRVAETAQRRLNQMVCERKGG